NYRTLAEVAIAVRSEQFDEAGALGLAGRHVTLTLELPALHSTTHRRLVRTHGQQVGDTALAREAGQWWRLGFTEHRRFGTGNHGSFGGSRRRPGFRRSQWLGVRH